MPESAQDKTDQNLRAIPEPTLRRLPLYHQYLKRMHHERKLDYISSNQIGDDLHVQPIQVRKDLEITKAIGKPKLGYDVAELIETIETFLGWNNTTDGYLVGVGHLGGALLGYQGFKEYGLNIIAAFDSDESKVGTEMKGIKVLHVAKLPNMIRRMGIKIGILTVPGSSAQELSDVMTGAGIKAIWNFSPIKIKVPGDVIVQHENLASSLVVLSKKLSLALASKEKQI
ncbi:MAG TPA: redox-sensing transcriptional repressor Rex [Syntrophorhabdaceae bacterium]|nr:redox-sensing transcriptional repressor Rex [Syntrophorhabdaceae bacterium]